MTVRVSINVPSSLVENTLPVAVMLIVCGPDLSASAATTEEMSLLSSWLYDPLLATTYGRNRGVPSAIEICHITPGLPAGLRRKAPKARLSMVKVKSAV